MALQSPAGLSPHSSSLQLNQPAPAASTQHRIYWCLWNQAILLIVFISRTLSFLPCTVGGTAICVLVGKKSLKLNSKSIRAKDRYLSKIIASRYPGSPYKPLFSFHRSFPPVALLWGTSIKQQGIPKQCQQWVERLLSFSWFTSPVLSGHTKPHSKTFFNYYFFVSKGQNDWGGSAFPMYKAH